MTNQAVPTLDALVAAARVEPPPLQNLPAIVNGETLLKTVFPEIAWLVENLLPQGLTILAGAPKRGKSWLALELAQAVCSGGHFLNRPAKRGRALFCALEDSPRRMQSRMAMQCWSAEAAANLDVIFSREFRALFPDSLAFASWLRREGYSLCVIDTLSRAFQSRDWNDTAAVVPVISPLQELAAESEKTILVIDHHRKRNGLGDNPVEDTLGSISKTGIADTIWGLYREPGKPGAKLAITGRDCGEQTFDVRFDGLRGCWQEVSAKDTLTQTQRETVDLLGELEKASLTELVEASGRNRGTLYRELQTLQEKGCVSYSDGCWQNNNRG
ncbi:MAG: AAA family ATPase [Bellilinea sp.]|jgi:hypothetical protein